MGLFYQSGITGPGVPFITCAPGGALQSQGTGLGSVVGNARGAGAVDLQTTRNDATMVASGAYAVLAGGISNKAAGAYTVIGGGQWNFAAGVGAGVGSGIANNTSGATVDITTGIVTGTPVDAVAGLFSIIGGGVQNRATGLCSVIGGGYFNLANGNYSFIGGGHSNFANGDTDVIAGGGSNYTKFAGSTVGGGYNNRATAPYSTIPGGRNNAASGIYATAFGYKATAALFGEMAHAAGNFASIGDAQSAALLWRNQTTDATPTELFLDGSSLSAIMPDATTWGFEIKLTARRTDAVADEFWIIQGCIRKSGAGTAVIVGSVGIVNVTATTTWTVVVDAFAASDVLRITVTGEDGKSINWVAVADLVEVSG